MQQKLTKLEDRLTCHKQIAKEQIRQDHWHEAADTLFEIINLMSEIKQTKRLMEAQTNVTILRKGEQNADNPKLLH